MAAETPIQQLGHLAATFDLGELSCQLLETDDGSYSLRYSAAESSALTEPMHSSKGAWSETLTIYEPALRIAIESKISNSPLRIASIGLGLGYNEILSVGLFLQAGFDIHDFQILTFESCNDLSQSFRNFFDKSVCTDTPSLTSLFQVYRDICERVANHCRIDGDKLKDSLEKLITNGGMRFYGVLNSALLAALDKQTAQSHCILFDAFSPDSSPDLWAEELLSALVAQLADPSCVLASYASRTVLKKILRQAGFHLEKKPGFAGKRESTLAIRGT